MCVCVWKGCSRFHGVCFQRSLPALLTHAVVRDSEPSWMDLAATEEDKPAPAPGALKRALSLSLSLSLSLNGCVCVCVCVYAYVVLLLPTPTLDAPTMHAKTHAPSLRNSHSALALYVSHPIAPASFPKLDESQAKATSKSKLVPAPAAHEMPPGLGAPPGLTFATPHTARGPDAAPAHVPPKPVRTVRSSRVQDERLQSLSDAGGRGCGRGRAVVQWCAVSRVSRVSRVPLISCLPALPQVSFLPPCDRFRYQLTHRAQACV
jgi:hypothetical protein